MSPPAERYGRVKLATIKRRFDDLREAVRSHDPDATEAAWLHCEAYVDFVFAQAVSQPATSESLSGC